MDRLLAPASEAKRRAGSPPGELDLLRTGLRQLEESLTQVGRGAGRRAPSRRPRGSPPRERHRTRIRTEVEER